jgi:hypothetical protein
MSFRLAFRLSLAAMIVASAIPARGQAVPAAARRGVSLTVGAGFSRFNLDWCCGRTMTGMTVWTDWNLQSVPPPLRGIGLELEARDISWDNPNIGRHRFDTGGGGPIYTLRRFSRVHPFAKFLVSYGSLDFNSPFLPPSFTHVNSIVYAPGGGADFRLSRHLSARGDFEYEMWPHLFDANALSPYGYTVGAAYRLGGFHSH